VVVTGASAGIGEAVARRFAASGAQLALAARGADRLEALADELRSAGTEVIAVPTDVADDQACADLLERAASNLGGIDILVNNAGANRRGPVEKFTAAELAGIVDVNLRAPILLSRLVLPYLRASGGGAIVNVASIAGRVPLSEAAVYSATKFGLRIFSFALADELAGSGVTVSAVSPGPVDTGFIMDDIDEVSDVVFSQPMSTADEIAAMVVDCAEDGKRERVTPRSSALLATLGYLVPGLRRVLLPVMRVRGRRAKDKYRRRERENRA
jgi:short-subunit dehydrogenase